MRSSLALYLVPFLAPVTDGSGGASDHSTPEPDAPPADIPSAAPSPCADDTSSDPSGFVADSCANAAEAEPGHGHRCGVDGGAPEECPCPACEGARRLFEPDALQHSVTVDTLVLVTVDGVEKEPIKLSVGVAVDVPADLVGPVFDFVHGIRAGIRAGIGGL